LNITIIKGAIDDAVVIDSTGLSIQEVFDRMMSVVRERTSGQ